MSQLWPPCVADADIIFLSSFFFYFPRLISAVAEWMSTILLHMAWPVRIQNAGLKCAARGSLQMQDPKIAKIGHLGTIAQLCRAIYSQLRHVSTIDKKNLLSSNIFSRRPHNMVNFGLLAAEIGPVVWGTPANFNGFRVQTALLYGTLVQGVSQTAAFNRRRHLYSAGRPSR